MTTRPESQRESPRESQSDGELDWRAFLYLEDEMSPPEREAFEERLLREQTAREALARMVELTRAVELVESFAGEHAGDAAGPAAARPQAKRAAPVLREAWVLIAGSVAAAVVFLVSLQSFTRPRGTPSDPAAGAELPRLALVWSEAQRRGDESLFGLFGEDNALSESAVSGGPVSDDAVSDSALSRDGAFREYDVDEASSQWLAAAPAPADVSSGGAALKRGDELDGLRAPDWMVIAVSGMLGEKQPEPALEN